MAQGTLSLRIRERLTKPGPNAFKRIFKRLFDVVAALVLLVLLAPLLLYVTWLLWCEDGAPVLFSQKRIGQGGREFSFLKFRSMVKNADAILVSWKTDNPALYNAYVANNFKLADDPRVISVGSWMRRTSIDELPQLINVIRGDMSLVGPRPLLARELPGYDRDALIHYHSVRPGITGLWQVSGRSGTTFQERANLDMRYVRDWSVRADFMILLRTFRVVFRREGAY